MRIGLEVFYVLFQAGVFLVQPVQIGFYFLNFLLLAVHGHEAMGAENIMKEKHGDKDRQQVRHIVACTCSSSLVDGHSSAIQILTPTWNFVAAKWDRHATFCEGSVQAATIGWIAGFAFLSQGEYLREVVVYNRAGETYYGSG